MHKVHYVTAWKCRLAAVTQPFYELTLDTHPGAIKINHWNLSNKNWNVHLQNLQNVSQLFSSSMIICRRLEVTLMHSLVLAAVQFDLLNSVTWDIYDHNRSSHPLQIHKKITFEWCLNSPMLPSYFFISWLVYTHYKNV